MTFVHRCGLCGSERPGDSETILDPACARCGGTLRAVPAAEIERARAEDAPGAPGATRRTDGTAVFALLVSGPWLLPLLGVHLGTVVFAIPLVLLAFAAQRLAVRARDDTRWSDVWRSLAVAASIPAAACLVGILSSALTGEISVAVFHLGAAGSLALVVAAALFARRCLRGVRADSLVDAALLAIVVGALALWFVVGPGVERGDLALTGVVVADLVALLLFSVAAIARGAARRRPAEWWLVGAAVAATAGDALVSAAASGQVPPSPSLVAVLWAAAGFALASAADLGLARDRAEPAEDRATGPRWLVWRLILPLAAVLCLPAVAGLLLIHGRLDGAGVTYFGILGLVALFLAFGRQAWLLVERQQAVVRERAARREATRQNQELQALTGLATTMTQTLEEAPIVEQALGVLATAARASSAALHLEGEGRPRLAAATGRWDLEHPWVAAGSVDEPQNYRRGRRSILRLPLAARGNRIGVVTLVRPAATPFGLHDVGLLGLLVDQLGLAVQNARDYREKLEQSIRDPLTGLYNRRFLLEALEKEVQRSERYGSEASLVIFDVDDFKLVNDAHGHAAGDDVLRAVGDIAERVIRPADSFARIGGEEFALLLPETSQLEALLVAERIRTAIARERLLPDRRVTVSGGIASCPGDATTAEDLQRRADGALYFAKRHGKDLCAVASEATAGDGDGQPGGESMIAHLYALVAMIDAQQLCTRDHSENVAAYAVAIGQELGLARERLVKLRRAAMLHDVGKIAVPSAVLAKPARLTDAEFEQVRAHPVVGGLMLAHAGLREEADWVRHHHERADGRGYPDRLPLADIPIEARILFVADAFEAMTSDRPYQAGVPVAEALAELRRWAGTQFDARVVEILERLVAEGRLAVLALKAE